MNEKEFTIFSDQYQMWLSQLMDADNYSELFYILYNIQFTWVEWMPMDENRAADGQYLRVIFSRDNNWDCGDYSEWPCSVLEMLIAFAIKIENCLCYDPEYGDRSSQWFWIMLKNLELDICDDRWFRENMRDGFQYVLDRVSTFLDRKYRKDGVGGLFPLNERDKNMQKTELWYQANWYMHEHYIRYNEV